MKITFLNALNSLTKTYSKKGDGSIIKTPYPMAYEFTSITEECRDLKHFEQLLVAHAAKGHCLLKGEVQRPLNKESRAGSTDSTGTTDWIVLDIDGMKGGSLDDLLSAMGFADISYVVQYSASYGIENKDLRCHIFMRLDRQISAPLLKQWLVHLNHTIPLLNDNLRLTKTNNSLSWALDISVCQNDKLIYIAPPIIKGMKDPMAKQARIEYVRKSHETLVIPQAMLVGSANAEKTNKRINELRTSLGLPARKFNFKVHGPNRILLQPDSSIITEMRSERGFVYFNLNGGDSWAYYHPEDNPEYIHNFKDEPSYLTKDLLPEYWKQITQQAVRVSAEGVTYLAFCDRKTGAYWRGTHSKADDTLDLYVAKNETQIRHFAKQYGVPLGDFVPEWDMEFNPHDNVRVDIENRSINTFAPTIYMQTVPKKTVKCPPIIFKVMNHALGNDVEVLEHFINWLAFIVQFRDRSKTAWVLHGVQGTGKGVLANKILRPLFGHHQTAMRRMEEFNEQYNSFMERCFLVFVDEVQTKALVNERGVMAKLKNFITEEHITVRQMYEAAHEVRNYTNWIFASNMPDPVAIDKEDRRFNVGKYQTERLYLTDEELAAIDKELQSFYDYLMQYAVDTLKASTPIETEDRSNMISISESSVDGVGSALLDGNFEFFLDQMPTTDRYTGNLQELNRVESYIDTLRALHKRTDDTGKCNISRDELRVLFEYCVGNIPNTPNKFTAMLRHHRIHVFKVWVGDRSVNGFKVVWGDLARFEEFGLMLNPVMKMPPKVAKDKEKK